MTWPRLGRTDLDAFGICLGGNVFGPTGDEPQSRAVLDASVGAGGNFIDTANSYPVEHGRSETIIGRGWRLAATAIGSCSRRRSAVVRAGPQPAPRDDRARGARVARAPADRSPRPLRRALR